MKTVVSRRRSANFGLLQKASPDRPKLTHIVLASRQVRSLPESEQSHGPRFALAQLSRCADRTESSLSQPPKLQLLRRLLLSLPQKLRVSRQPQNLLPVHSRPQKLRVSLRRRIDGLPPSSPSRHDVSPIL